VSIADDLSKLPNAGSDIKAANTPQEWRARLDVGNDGGYFISTPRTAGDLPDAVELFKDFDLDPTVWTVVSVRKSRWQRYDGEWLEAARVSIKPAQLVRHELEVDVEKLMKEISKWRPSKVAQSTGDLTYISCSGDEQVGKDAGGGTKAIVERVKDSVDESINRYKELIKYGRPIGQICLPQLADNIEGCVSQNGKVMTRSDLGVSDQVRVSRRLLTYKIKSFAPYTDSLIVPAINGNHDETTRFGLTNPNDSWQIDVVSQVQDICAENPALAHVKFRYPESDNSTLAIDLNGTSVGFAHGHQTKGNPVKWWSGQSAGLTPVGLADVLITAHYHHFQTADVGQRLWLQVPAMDGGSPWFRDARGLESRAGILTLVVGNGYDPRRDIAILAGESR